MKIRGKKKKKKKKKLNLDRMTNYYELEVRNMCHSEVSYLRSNRLAFARLWLAGWHGWLPVIGGRGAFFASHARTHGRFDEDEDEDEEKKNSMKEMIERCWSDLTLCDEGKWSVAMADPTSFDIIPIPIWGVAWHCSELLYIPRYSTSYWQRQCSFTAIWYDSDIPLLL